MATLSHLIAVIASVEGIDVERATAIGRAVREAALIKTSGRGTSAAQMDERDAASLLIAVNMADTARSAPAAVAQYWALQAKRSRTTKFGIVLEQLISAARREVLTEYLTDMVALLGAPNHVLGRRPFATQISIEFEKPTPSVVVGISDQRGRNDYIEFLDRGLRSGETSGDRRERTRITQRTILAVADILRT